MSNFEAIKYIYPEVEFTMTNDDTSTIIWHTEGITTPTKKQIEDAIIALEIEKENSNQQKIQNKESALNKLKALGLTEDEAKALVGI